MRSINWLNKAGYFFGVWVISMGGQWSVDYSGFSLILVPVDQTNASNWVYGIQALVTIYTIAMLGATGYSLYRFYSEKKGKSE